MESGAILTYLSRKTSKLMPSDLRLQSETEQWLHFQMGGVGPMFGQFGHFYKFIGDKCDHPYPEERYRTEIRRQLGVLDKRLEGTEYLVGDQYTIADIATFPWVGCVDWAYGAWEHLGVEEFPTVVARHKRCEEKPESIRGNAVCGFD
jgi:GST-like protein